MNPEVFDLRVRVAVSHCFYARGSGEVTPEMGFAMCVFPTREACCAREKDVCNVVDGMSGGLVEAEALLVGKKAMAFVTRPFRRGFLGSNADSNCAVGVLLVPVQDINVILGCLHKYACGFDLFDTILPLVGLCAGDLGN